MYSYRSVCRVQEGYILYPSWPCTMYVRCTVEHSVVDVSGRTAASAGAVVDNPDGRLAVSVTLYHVSFLPHYYHGYHIITQSL